jgi:hypothetical protein
LGISQKIFAILIITSIVAAKSIEVEKQDISNLQDEVDLETAENRHHGG